MSPNTTPSASSVRLAREERRFRSCCSANLAANGTKRALEAQLERLAGGAFHPRRDRGGLAPPPEGECSHGEQHRYHRGAAVEGLPEAAQRLPQLGALAGVLAQPLRGLVVSLRLRLERLLAGDARAQRIGGRRFRLGAPCGVGLALPPGLRAPRERGGAPLLGLPAAPHGLLRL